MELDLATHDEAGATVVVATGEIDLYTAPQLEAALRELVIRPIPLVVDLRGVDFIDSTGLRVLVACLHEVQALGGTLALVADQERVLKVFRITGLTKVFDLHAELAPAVAAVSAED